MQQQADDLRMEGRALRDLLAAFSETDWERPTLFKAWTANDILQHLHSGDRRATASITDPELFDRLSEQIRSMRTAGRSRLAETRKAYAEIKGPRLLEAWHLQLEALCGMIGALQPEVRLKWSGPDMGARSFTSARQMEVWAHGQALYDLAEAPREPTDRLRNIAELGVRTFAWTFRNRAEPMPPVVPRVTLRAPSGAIWEWNPSIDDERIDGDALPFCQVVAQTRNVADTDLTVVGPVARRWMAIAQCFAGPPETPPPPGMRLGRPR